MIIYKFLIIFLILLFLFIFFNIIFSSFNKDNFNNYKKTIYFVINQNYNHRSIITEGSGASEFLFYITLYKLSKYYNIVVYNNSKLEIIDGIKYQMLNNDFIKNINNSIVIVQRDKELLKTLRNINEKNNYILWTHDHKVGIETDEYFFENNITIVTVSEFHLSTFPNKNNVKFIYNALFSEYFIKNHNINYNKDAIIFASSWNKGIDNILKIGEAYYNKNKNFQLILIKPSYSIDTDIDLIKYPFINIKGTIKNKKQYCELIQSCLCLLTTSFPETFGCIYTEALHLGVPVIGDNSVNSAIKEIVQSEHMCNYNNVDEVINKIETFRKNRPIVSLNNKFYENAVIEEWKKLINFF
jgi:hypothetical protein